MEYNGCYSITEKVNDWAEGLKAKPSFTESDIEEMKGHLFDSCKSLMLKGLSEEEAFILAKLRMGDSPELDEAFKEANQPVLQMRRSLYILAGVLVYFAAYFFILSTSKLLLLLLLQGESGANEAVSWISRYLVTWHFIFLLFLVSIYFLEAKTIAFLERFKFPPKITVVLIAFVVVIALVDHSLLPEVKNMMKDVPLFRSNLIQNYNYFELTFPFLMWLGFVLIYFKYYKKTKV
jgi:hypothetical protein